MQYQRAFPYLLAVISVSSAAQAQVVEGIFVAKLKFYEQSSATQVNLIPSGQFPFGIDLNVEGANIDLLSPAPSVSGPISVPAPGNNGGVLGYNPADGIWRYGFPNFDDWGTATQGELDGLFGSGVYTFNIGGVSVPLTLTGDLYSSAAPQLTLSGGVWTNGVYSLPSNRTLTITTNTYAEYGTNPEDAVYLDVYGPGFETELLNFASVTPQNFLSLVIPANTLLAGNSYEVEGGFLGASDFTFSATAFPGAMAAAFYDQATSLMIVVEAPAPGIAYCLGDGDSTACPCNNNNDDSNGAAGCANGASPGGASVTGTGIASVSGDTVVLHATGVQPSQPGLWFQANNAINSGAGITFGDGLRCAGGNIVRMGVVVADNLGNSSSPAGLGSALSGGDVKRYQLWYRNPGGSPCGSGFNLSNGYEISWTL